jgi:hypothetical protein
MGLLSRIRNRLAPRPPVSAPLGNQLPPDLDTLWAELPEQVDAYMKKIGSSIVSSWEVGAAETSRRLIGRPDEKRLIERFSDALVPTLAPYQALHKQVPSVMQAALKAVKSQKNLNAAVPDLLKLVEGLGEQAAEGWLKTVDYLEPLLALTHAPTQSTQALKAGDAEFKASALRHAQILQSRLEALPKANSLFTGICDAFEAYQIGMSRDLEIHLDKQTRILMKELR